jgi:hypothetical protein
LEIIKLNKSLTNFEKNLQPMGQRNRMEWFMVRQVNIKHNLHQIYLHQNYEFFIKDHQSGARSVIL